MKKKNIAAIVLTVMALFAVCFWGRLSVEAASGKAATKKWAKAYMKIVKKMNKEDAARKASGKWGTISYKPYTYDLIYFDNDSIPELVVGLDGYWVSMYTYDKKKAKVYNVMDQWGYGVGGNHGYEYLPKKNSLMNGDADYAGAEYHVFFGKMKNHKIVNRNAKDLVIKYYIDKNKNGYPDADEYTEKPSYYYGNKKISKKKFNSYIPYANKKYKPIIGKMSYAKMKKKLTALGA